MAISNSSPKKKVILFIFATVVVALALYFYNSLMGPHIYGGSHTDLFKIPVLAFAALLGYLGIRALNAALFDLAFRLRRGYEAPTLVRNIFTLIAFTILFVAVFKSLYTDVNLVALFTTSAIFGVIIGLALQA